VENRRMEVDMSEARVVVGGRWCGVVIVAMTIQRNS